MYEYLEKYKSEQYEKKGIKFIDWPQNLFHALDSNQILEAEKLIGFSFPLSLSQFYKLIGYGKLTSPIHVNDEYVFHGANEILPPVVAATFYQAIIRFQTEEIEEPIECEDFYLNNSILDMFEPGDLPFFEISDSNRFLYMKLNSDNPNAVYAFGDILIEESFERFVWRLYHEDTSYFDDVIEEYYKRPKH